MMLTFEYRIKPSPKQAQCIDHWLELLRRHWNYALGQRLDWLRRTRCTIDRCSLISEPIGEIPQKVNYYSQQSDLKQTKILFPDYKDIYCEVQQINIQRLDKAWKRWLVPDKKGKRGGRPRFKKAGQLRSFSFSRVNHPKSVIKFQDNSIWTRKWGVIPVIVHRRIPDDFSLKTATIVRCADGYYVCLTAEEETVPTLLPKDKIQSAVGIDVGLKDFLTTSKGETVAVKKIYRNRQNYLARQQRKLARKVKGSKNHEKQQKTIALTHQKIKRHRKDWHYKTAHWLVKNYDFIAGEDLNIKGLARTKLAKSTHPSSSPPGRGWGWVGNFLMKLEAVAVKRGVWFVKVSPHGTTINCSNCGHKVPKTLSVRLQECPSCNLTMDRDENAAINILKKALEIHGVGHILSAWVGLVDRQPVNQETSYSECIQLSLF
ncbi:MAG: transposase [Moorea sp. SIO2B7]|nr:transposase [Moorena sp. SIO2B7]